MEHKRVKLEEGGAGGRLRCQHVMEQKKRQCAMTRRAGSKYCLEHLSLLGAGGVERVPCPLDPKHTVWEHQLRAHLRKCNTFKAARRNDGEKFYKLDGNIGSGLVPDTRVESLPDGTWRQVLQLLDCSVKVRASPIRQKANEYLDSTRLETLENRKHAEQQSSLIQHLLEACPPGRHRTFVEFGCGRAEFSRYVNQAYLHAAPDPPDFVLVDRSSNRMKFDTKIAKDTEEMCPSASNKVTRVKIDIKDLQMDPLLEGAHHCVAISKHLCGVATDLTLRCIASSERMRGGLDAVCIAMCCRHVCNARDYINPPFFDKLLQEARDSETSDPPLTYKQLFQCLAKMCSWATSGRRPGAQDTDMVTVGDAIEMTLKQRDQYGLLSRQLIDEGSLQWARENLPNSRAELIKYVDSSVSLENVALFLTK
ncbi:tRNA:m4X modification enzyme KNAG_0A01350 [Huiozyma naganishii CBS 8797]|uniref:tRNA:m(4)X modification enzyme TRM13 n=1 Tax=Huiozyma naganishii (strain ATCC MYA-139 / BCRC 22969 / CBS 8797 / KCTC 17520 / NBRC 10181 / NCYC 3082 / Yp74L-3) TaxID=1071383 RepID=J7S1U4_HUIN7|nr:hypothetical protein KNAG_0A01350 [Kazachstania naganishii CBS 8797]CCK67824.1 hypothetical protein KNAG_0A01350 [Kazachstania naganishii CBS 8797]